LFFGKSTLIGDILEADNDLKEAIEACAKIIEEKCGNKPYMVVISKANLKFASAEDKKKKKLTGTASYMYSTKPPIAKNGVSKLLISTTKLAIDLAEKELNKE
jgi:hypothetical protein